MAQQLRSATPIGEGPLFLIRDNDDKQATFIGRVDAGAGTEVGRTPHGAPRANAICERFLGSLRRECLDFFVLFGESRPHRIVGEYVDCYFNHARPHQGVQQPIPSFPRYCTKAAGFCRCPLLEACAATVAGERPSHDRRAIEPPLRSAHAVWSAWHGLSITHLAVASLGIEFHSTAAVALSLSVAASTLLAVCWPGMRLANQRTRVLGEYRGTQPAPSRPPQMTSGSRTVTNVPWGRHSAIASEPRECAMAAAWKAGCTQTD